MTTLCAGCGNNVAPLEHNFGEFWYGITMKNSRPNEFAVHSEDGNVFILGHKKVYFCPDCLRAVQQNCMEPNNALDQYAIALRKVSHGDVYRYFTRKDFAELKFS